MTAREDFGAKRQGYAAGGDDYMVKPIDLEELVLRVGALLRRAKIAQSHTLTVGGFDTRLTLLFSYKSDALVKTARSTGRPAFASL